MCCHGAPFTCEREGSCSADVACVRRGMCAANPGIPWPRSLWRATGLTENGKPYSYGMVEFSEQLGKIM